MKLLRLRKPNPKIAKSCGYKFCVVNSDEINNEIITLTFTRKPNSITCQWDIYLSYTIIRVIGYLTNSK